MGRIAFITLGCKVNQYETDAIKAMFIKRGDEIVSEDEAADVFVINTCTITQMSEKKSRQMIRRARRENPEAIVVVMGCYSQIAPDEIMGLGGVNLVLGTKDRGRILEYLDALSYNESTSVVREIEIKEDFEELSIDGSDDRTRVFLKIQDGCNRMCSYCIIPYARGSIRSRTPENAYDEVVRVVENGYKEVVLTGIHLSSYGFDLGKIRLIDIIEEICTIDGLERLRLGSLEPRVVTDEFAKRLSQLPQICDQFHLSLQSGSQGVLDRMNRKYTPDEFENCANNLRKYFKNPALTTDVIVGFPEETDEEFEESYEFCKKIGFSQMHIFKYSPRYGTPAAKIKNQISEDIKTERSKRMLELSDEMKAKFENSLIGTEQDVLVEKCGNIEFKRKNSNGEFKTIHLKYAEGKSRNHLPVLVFGLDISSNEMCKVMIKSNHSEYMLAGDDEMIEHFHNFLDRGGKL